MSLKMLRRVLDLIQQHKDDLFNRWVNSQEDADTTWNLVALDDELKSQAREFLDGLAKVDPSEDTRDMSRRAWSDVRDVLDGLSRTWAEQGFSPSQTATFVFSLKQPLFDLLVEELKGDTQSLRDAQWEATTLIDKLGLHTVENYQKTREEIIMRQRQEIDELSTPVVRLWDEILAVPLIGTLDSARTQMIMENLLNRIVETQARIIIIDITGVSVVDTLVAQYILKTAQATRLMGAECYLSGISPQIAQTIVHLGINLHDLVTKSNLKEAFATALRQLNVSIIDGH